MIGPRLDRRAAIVRIFNRGGRALQNWATKLGFGRLTGIDTGAEAVGTVPSRAQRAALNRAEAKCRREEKKRACGIADGTNRPYNLGDNVNLAIGQGDLTATPLQVALSYAAIATGGRVPTPHLGAAVEDERGELVQKLVREPARRVELPAAGLAAVRDGLRQAAGEEKGTSAAVFDGWDQGRWPVHGTTGTAEVAATGLDQSWYAAYVAPNGHDQAAAARRRNRRRRRLRRRSGGTDRPPDLLQVVHRQAGSAGGGEYGMRPSLRRTG